MHIAMPGFFSQRCSCVSYRFVLFLPRPISLHAGTTVYLSPLLLMDIWCFHFEAGVNQGAVNLNVNVIFVDIYVYIFISL